MLDSIRRRLGWETRALTEGAYGWLMLPTKAGPSVTAENALQSPTVLACYRLITETVAQLPVHVYQRQADGGKERAVDHDAYAVLHDWANPWCSAFDLKRTLTGDAILRGDGFAAVVRSEGRVRELHRLNPDAVTVDVNEASGEPSYKFRTRNNVERRYGFEEIVHVPGVPCGPGKSKAIIHLAREAIAVDMAMSECQGKLFANGARPAGVLRFKGKVSDPQAERIRAAWDDQHGGAGNAGKTAVLEMDAEFQQISLSSVDAQFLELRRLAIEEIGRAFRVPPVLIGDLQRATWRNAEELGRQFLIYSLMPWIKAWENALTRAVLKPEERKRFFVEFLVDDLVRGDIAARYEAFAKAVGGPWLTANEARSAENRPPVDGGDDLRAPLNTAPAADSKPTPPDPANEDEEEEQRLAA